MMIDGKINIEAQPENQVTQYLHLYPSVATQYSLMNRMMGWITFAMNIALY